MTRATKSLEDRLFPKIEATGFCWNWTAAKTKKDGGYGVSWVNGKLILAHRLVYQWLVKQIAPGMTLDHLCRNKLCVNPDHLEEVTHRVNNLRGRSAAAMNARRITCSKGHRLDGRATSKRYCKTCARETSRKLVTCAECGTTINAGHRGRHMQEAHQMIYQDKQWKPLVDTGK